MDEPYTEVSGKWKYLFRAIDKRGTLIEFMLSDHRKTRAAPRVSTRGPVKEYSCPLFLGSCVIRQIVDGSTLTYSTVDPVHGQGTQFYSNPLRREFAVDFDVSPDGTLLALPSRDPTNPEIRLIRIEATPAGSPVLTVHVRLSAQIEALNWAADQRGWFVSKKSPIGKNLYFVNFEGSPTPLRQLTGSTWAVPSPDGKKIAFVDDVVDSNLWLLRWPR